MSGFQVQVVEVDEFCDAVDVIDSSAPPEFYYWCYQQGAQLLRAHGPKTPKLENRKSYEM
jgi:hypothetical protein